MEKVAQDLINRLIQKTEKNQAVWNKTSRSNEFKIELSNGKITTDVWFNEEESWSGDFRLYNDNGDEIYSVCVQNDSESEDFNLLSKLNTVIKNKYYKVEETIEGVLEEVSGDDIIGIPPF